MPRGRKPPRPYIYLAHPLWRQCIFVHAVGWMKGPRSASPELASLDERRRVRADIVPSGDAGNYQSGDVGRGMANNASPDTIDYGDANNQYLPPDNEMSIMVQVRMNVIPASGTASGILDKGTSPASTTNLEYSMGINGTASTFRFYVTPLAGAAQAVNSTTLLSLLQTFVLVGTYFGGARLRMYVDGTKEGEIVPGNNGIKDNGQVLAWFQLIGGGGSVITNAYVTKGAAWRRELSSWEARELSRDYVMHKWPHPRFMGMRHAGMM